MERWINAMYQPSYSYLRTLCPFFCYTELSEVLWTMVLQIGIGIGATSPAFGAIVLLGVFAVWAGKTPYLFNAQSVE